MLEPVVLWNENEAVKVNQQERWCAGNKPYKQVLFYLLQFSIKGFKTVDTQMTND